MTDTDSLMIDITHPNMHELFPKLGIDTSTFPEGHEYRTMENAKVGKLKCETGGKLIIAHYNPTTKVYYFMDEDGKEKRVCKGLPAGSCLASPRPQTMIESGH